MENRFVRVVIAVRNVVRRAVTIVWPRIIIAVVEIIEIEIMEIVIHVVIQKIEVLVRLDTMNVRQSENLITIQTNTDVSRINDVKLTIRITQDEMIIAKKGDLVRIAAVSQGSHSAKQINLSRNKNLKSVAKFLTLFYEMKVILHHQQNINVILLPPIDSKILPVILPLCSLLPMIT
eukprot:UN29938